MTGGGRGHRETDETTNGTEAGRVSVRIMAAIETETGIGIVTGKEI
jgi:hypothetical protein